MSSYLLPAITYIPDLDKHIIKYTFELTNRDYMYFPPLNIDYGEITKYWSNDYGFLIWNIIIDKKYYLLQSPITLIKQMSRTQNKITKKSTKKLSKKSSKKSTRKINRYMKRMDKMENDYDKIIERINKIYKQIVK